MTTIDTEEYDFISAVNLIKPYYNQPWRVYHDWSHIEQGLQVYKKYFKNFAEQKYSSQECDVIILAWLLHDVVYLPGSPYNEDSSARMVHYFCSHLTCNHLSKHVRRLVLATAHCADPEVDKILYGAHGTEFDAGADIIVDMDLYGFSQCPGCFKNGQKLYLEQRLFFKPIPEDEKSFRNNYAKGAVAFAQKLLDRKSIYLSTVGSQWEEDARANIKKDIEFLKSGKIVIEENYFGLEPGECNED